MDTYPITPEQEQELRAWARRIYSGEGVKRAKHPEHVVPIVAGLIGGHVFTDGRLSSTVSAKTRLQIAREEKPKEGKKYEQQDKTKHDIKSKLESIKIANRVGRSLCLHCGEKPMAPNSGLCVECRRLPRYQELLAE